MKHSMQICFSAAALVLLAHVAVGAEPDMNSAPPVVVKTVPVSGDEKVDPGVTEIKVTFSKTMMDQSWSWSTWGETNYPKTTGKPYYLPDKKTCVLPVKLEPGRFYAIYLNSDKFKGFTDASGTPSVPYLLNFSTADGKLKAGQPGATIHDAVMTISQCAEGDPRVASALAQLSSVSRQELVSTLLSDLQSDTDTVRRAAIYICWKGNLDSLEGLVKPLMGLMGHSEDLTRGMAALALGQKKAEGCFEPLVKMAQDDKSGYARRCAVYALGLLGNTQAEPVLKEAAKDPEAMVRNNAAAALEMLKKPQAKNVAISGIQGASPLLNKNQQMVYDWTERQFRSYFDRRTFDGWSESEKSELEKKSMDALKGPETRDYYTAINTLGAMKSAAALPALKEIAFSRLDKNNRDRWMAIRALGLMKDKTAVPDLIHLLYHGNVNTHWWAQIALVQITGANFGGDWAAWGKWWNEQKGEPPYKSEVIRWWSGQPEPEKLAESIADSDKKFLEILAPKTPENEEKPANQTAVAKPEAIGEVKNPIPLFYDNGNKAGMESIAASGQGVCYDRPGDGRYLEAVQIYASRYGADEAPREDFHVYVLNEKSQILADVKYPYSLINKGDMQWYTLRTPSIEVPEKFIVAFNFNAHRTKGIYIGFSSADKSASHSRIGLPGDGYEPCNKPLEWMVRLTLSREATKVKGMMALADWKPPVVNNPFAGCKIAAFGTEKSEDKQSYGGRGPAIRFAPSAVLKNLKEEEGVTLKGLRIYAGRYGSGYDPEQTKFKVTVQDGKGNKLGTSAFSYSLLNYRERWIDLVFDQAIKIKLPADTLTISFDPEATQYKGIYFFYEKNPATSRSLAGTVDAGFKPVEDREWLMKVMFE